MKLRGDILLLFTTILIYSCSNSDVTKPVSETEFTAYQISGCNKQSHFGKITDLDSCFNYTFDDSLKIDFCVVGNCCPDSNRFVTDYQISTDTIYVTVADTAENLCKCMCNYIVHLELSGLEKNEYLFYCDFDSLQFYRENIRNDD
jgi:hypothetical protein